MVETYCVVATIFVQVWSAMQSGFIYRLNVPRRLLKATTTTVDCTDLTAFGGSIPLAVKIVSMQSQLCAPFRGANDYDLVNRSTQLLA